MSGYTRTEGRPQKDTIVPRFHMEAIPDPVASAAEGRQCWKQDERVQLLVPGSPNQLVERVNDDHRQRWPEAYAAFKKGLEMAVDGIPLEQWAALNKAQVYELKAQNIFTVEQCAGLSDAFMQKVPYGRRLRDLAKAYVDEAYEQAALQKAMAERDQLQGQVSDLKGQVAELSRLVTDLHGRMMNDANRPHPLAAVVPSDYDRIEQAKMQVMQGEVVESSFANLPEARRRPGRPTNAERAAREAVAEA